MTIDAQRLWQRLDALAEITEPDRPWTRRSFTPRFLAGRAWLAAEFAAAGLEVRLDAGGNLIGRLAGSNPDLPPLVAGSHSDSVPSGGRYDGMLGVIAALEVAQSLREQGRVLAHDVEVVDFLAEEPSEFGLSCVGSRSWAGKLDATMLATTRPDGMTLREGLLYVGADPDRLATAYRAPGSIAAYVELHIEQARILESGALDIGVVTGIAAIRRERITVIGRADHAGQTPMGERADALVGAARIIDGAYRDALAGTTSACPLVATVGYIGNVKPNAANAVPGQAELIMECRCLDEERVIGLFDGLFARLNGELTAMDLEIRREVISHVPATPCTAAIQDTISAAARELGFSQCHLPSGAGHDGMFASHAGPFGMIFVPCLDGRSHTPEEWLEPEQAAAGARVLFETICRLDAQGATSL